MNWNRLLFGLILCIQSAQCYRILLTSIPMSGHLNPILMLASELAENGHDCTVAVVDSVSRPSNLPKAVKWISIKQPHIPSGLLNEIMLKLGEEHDGVTFSLLQGMKMFLQTVHQSTVRYLIADNETRLQPGEWDAVITDLFTLCGADLSFHLKAPLTIFTTALLFPFADFFQAPQLWWHPSPLLGLWPDGSWMNTFGNIAINLMTRIYLRPRTTRMWLDSRANLTAPWNDLTPLKDFINGPPPLVLIGSFQAFDWPLSLPPHIKYIGLVVPTAQLNATMDSSLKNWLDNANTPIVYFSFGTLVRLSNDSVRLFVESFSSMSFKYHVLWSLRGPAREYLESKPDLMGLISATKGRFRIEHFVPQLAVLNHENVKVLFTHGGFNTISEAVWTGKPMLGMPFYGDQRGNVDRIVRLGIGLHIPNPFNGHVTPALIQEKLSTLVENRTFAENCHRLSLVSKLYPGFKGAVPIIERNILQGGTKYYQQDSSSFQGIVISAIIISIFALVLRFAVQSFISFVPDFAKKYQNKLKTL